MKFSKMARSKAFGLGMSMLAALVVASGAYAQNDKPPATPPATPAPVGPAKQPTPPATPATPDKKAEQPAEPLPKAEEVLDRFVKETGGKEAYAAIKSMVKTGKINMMMQIEGPMKEYVVRPNKLYSEITLGQFGEMKSGSDGETVWQDS